MWLACPCRVTISIPFRELAAFYGVFHVYASKNRHISIPFRELAAFYVRRSGASGEGKGISIPFRELAAFYGAEPFDGFVSS